MNRDQLRNPTLGNRVWATFTFSLPYNKVVCVRKLFLLQNYEAVDKIFANVERRRMSGHLSTWALGDTAVRPGVIGQV